MPALRNIQRNSKQQESLESCIEYERPLSLQRFLEERQQNSLLKASPFPLKNLLELYSRSARILYLNHFEGLKLLIAWLSPISPSTKPHISIPTYLITYEMQEIARHTGNSVSQIYQELTELTELWKPEKQICDSNISPTVDS